MRILAVLELLVVLALLGAGMTAIAAGGLFTGCALCLVAGLWARSLYRRI